MGKKRFVVTYNLAVTFYIVFYYAMDAHIIVAKPVAVKIEIND